MKVSKSVVLAGALLLVVTGLLLAKMIDDVPYFVLDSQIDIVGLVALLLTVFVSVLFYRTFEKRKHSDQLQKASVLERLEISFSNLDKLDEACGVKKISYLEIVRRIKKCRREFASFCEYATELGYPVTESQSANYRMGAAELKDLLTNSPRQAVKGDISISAGIITLSPNREVEVENSIDAARAVLSSIKKDVILNIK